VTKLRLMTFNMLHAPGDRLGPLVETVRSVAPDILACQEVNTYDGMMQLSRELDMLPIWGPANSAEDNRGGHPVYEHLVLLTKLAPNLVRVHPGDRRAMFRPVLEARFQPPGGPEITVFTVHFRAVVDPGERYLKYRELGSFLSVLSDAAGPVVALGDFNARPPGEAGEAVPDDRRPEDHVAAVRGDVVNAIVGSGLVDSYRLAQPYPGRPETTLAGSAGARVDHIFVSSCLGSRVTASYILDNELVRTASDHMPVVTELTWPE
jgi:endonuclease/exonuclease/phosphatase family metal-dependent hydrolase